MMSESVILIQAEENIIYGPFKDEEEVVSLYNQCRGEEKGWTIIGSLPKEIMLEFES